MKEELRKIVEEMIASRWVEQYALVDVAEHQYGYSLIFLNKKSNNRFSPTIISNQLVHQLFTKNSQGARLAFQNAIETAFEKERISG
jgi:hypothetical protein